MNIFVKLDVTCYLNCLRSFETRLGGSIRDSTDLRLKLGRVEKK